MALYTNREPPRGRRQGRSKEVYVLKAHLKINVSIHLEETGEASLDPRALEALKYPLATQYAGVKVVMDKSSAERALAGLQNHIANALIQLSFAPPEVTGHVPDLAAAFGGDPEPAEPAGVRDDPSNYKEYLQAKADGLKKS